jgi:hypothetical protein
VNQRQTLELHGLLKQVKQQDEAQEYLNRQIVKHIQDKHKANTRLEEVEAAFKDVSEKYELVKREHAAVLENNKLLEKRARDLSQESQLFLTQLMELKEKQIEKYNEANDLYHEVETMRAKLELANLPEFHLK